MKISIYKKTIKRTLTAKLLIKFLDWISLWRVEISLLKIKNWAALFQNWLNFHFLEWESTSKNLESKYSNNHRFIIQQQYVKSSS